MYHHVCLYRTLWCSPAACVSIWILTRPGQMRRSGTCWSRHTWRTSSGLCQDNSSSSARRGETMSGRTFWMAKKTRQCGVIECDLVVPYGVRNLWSKLIWVEAWCLTCAKKLHEPLQNYSPLESKKHISVKFQQTLSMKNMGLKMLPLHFNGF